MVIDQAGVLRYRGAGVNVSEISSMIDNLIGVSTIENKERLAKFTLNQNYPNPFNPSTVISFEISNIQKVSLKVYDNQGRFVRSLLNNTMHVGRHEISWDGRNNQGESVSAGVYYYMLQTASFDQTKKMTLIR
jgi:flagellar hook assembly protein FlgD